MMKIKRWAAGGHLTELKLKWGGGGVAMGLGRGRVRIGLGIWLGGGVRGGVRGTKWPPAATV